MEITSQGESTEQIGQNRHQRRAAAAMLRKNPALHRKWKIKEILWEQSRARRRRIEARHEENRRRSALRRKNAKLGLGISQVHGSKTVRPLREDGNE